MLEEMLRHIDRASLFGPWIAALAVMLGVNVTLTFVHALQELRGRLWRYFGAIVGLWIPDPLGVVLFFVLLTLALWTIGWIGITGYLPVVGQVEGLAAWSIGFLVGGRLSDRLYSHVRLDREGYRPNPGLKSTPLYLAEAVLLTIVFLPALIDHYILGPVGFVLGWGFFFGVLPALRLFRFVPFLRREPWKAGERSPAWARLPLEERAGECPAS